MIQRVWPEHWSSWRSFEATRAIYNIASKHNFLDEMKTEIGKYCDFLHPELNTERTLMILKELFNMVANNMSNVLTPFEIKALSLEIAVLAANREPVVMTLKISSELCSLESTRSMRRVMKQS